MKQYYFQICVRSNKATIHTEIVLIEERNPTTDKVKSIIFNLRQACLDTLFASDSMSSYSRVRPIRERLDELKGQLSYTVDLIENNVKALDAYSLQNKERDPSLGYLFDRSFKTTEGYLW